MAKNAKPLSYIAFAIGLLCLGLLIQPWQQTTPPNIQGVVIPEGRAIANFTLVDQHQQPFTQQNLKGHWSIVAYGYTDCPDICPVTLSKLVQLKHKLKKSKKAYNPKVLFYTVDPLRDTAERLHDYMAFFDEDFVGLSWGPALATEHIPFEQSLGIVSAIKPLPAEAAAKDHKGYGVSHGVALFVINQQGKLQAVLQPHTTVHGSQYFRLDTLYKDFVALRSYYKSTEAAHSPPLAQR